MNTWVTDQMAAKHGAALVRLFSGGVIRDLATTGHSALASRVLRESGADQMLDPSLTLGDGFDSLFGSLFRKHRSEYTYKNAIANRILLGTHSLNSSFMVTEFRALDCKADCVIVNGTSHVYEIKSEFDSMARLRGQIAAYRTIFDHIHVITSETQLDAVTESVDEDVGLMVLNNRQSISTVREADSLRPWTKPSAIFDSLRKSEYIQIIEKQFGEVPNVPNTKIYQACRRLFCDLSPETAHDEMVRILKERGNSNSLRSFVLSVPYSLKAASLACDLSPHDRALFTGLLQTNARSVLLAA